MQNKKCDLCNRVATVHLTTIKSGKKVEQHFCEHCAQKSETPKPHQPINELLTNFVLQHSNGLQHETGTTCPACGLAWAEFRQSGLFGCEHDYEAFEKDLAPLLQRAHDGATHHVGKVPARRGGAAVPARRQLDLARLRKELAAAVEAEDYERAAVLRDQIRTAETA